MEIARLLTRCANRPADIVARVGGEEFGVLLPNTAVEGAEQVAQRIQNLLRSLAIPHEGSPLKRMTLSIGISMIDGTEVTEIAESHAMAEMFEQADRALYEIKRRGRDGILKFWGKGDLTAAPKTGAA